MWYLRDIEHKCDYYSCHAPAKVELIGPRNASYGIYCRQHGKAKLSQRNVPSIGEVLRRAQAS